MARLLFLIPILFVCAGAGLVFPLLFSQLPWPVEHQEKAAEFNWRGPLKPAHTTPAQLKPRRLPGVSVKILAASLDQLLSVSCCLFFLLFLFDLAPTDPTAAPWQAEAATT